MPYRGPANPLRVVRAVDYYIIAQHSSYDQPYAARSGRAMSQPQHARRTRSDRCGPQPGHSMNQMPNLQSLPRASALLCLEVERFCLRQLALPKGASLVLAVSGGADSTALALILSLLAPRLNLRLSALSVNHGLRPEADEDAAHALAVCHALGMHCTVRAADVRGFAASRHMGEEEAGRAVRYALLEEERVAQNAHFIALGHHCQDLSEDIVLRLVRGAGWPSLGGMPARDDARCLLRPLLACEPDDLRQLLRQCGLGWREDASNQSLDYRRNRLRLQTLPLLRAENPSLDRTLGHMWQLANLDRDYWEKTLDEALAANPWQEMTNERQDGLPALAALTLPRALLRPLHPAARLRLYMRALQHLCSSSKAVISTGAPALPPHSTSAQARASTLLALDEALTQGRGNTRFQLPGGIEAHLKGGGVTFTRAL